MTTKTQDKHIEEKNSYTRAVEEGREKEGFNEYPVKRTVFSKIKYK